MSVVTVFSLQEARVARDIRTEVQTDVRNALRDAARQLKEASGAQDAPLPAMDPATAVTLMQSEITQLRQEIASLTKQLTNGTTDAAESAINTQIDAATERISALQHRIDAVTSGQTEIVLRDAPALPDQSIPREVVDLSLAFFATCAIIAVGIPLARGISRWLEKRGAPPDPELSPRLDRIEQAVEAVAIEVERISEGQRFSSRILSEMKGLPAPDPASAWPGQAARVPVQRGGER